MTGNDRNPQQQPGSTQQTQAGNQDGQSQNQSSKGQDENPQGGGHWNNYQTRELSDEGTGDGNASTPERK